jgi:hypothetical protein
LLLLLLLPLCGQQLQRDVLLFQVVRLVLAVYDLLRQVVFFWQLFDLRKLLCLLPAHPLR